MTPRIYLSPPDVGEQERKLLLDALDSNWITCLGPHVNAFESELAEYVDVRAAVALSSGTAALHLALIVLGVERGDRVLCSTMTFVASANAILYCGAEPVFIDSEDVSWNMDPDLLEEELQRSAARGRLPRAVIVVDLFGQTANYERIEAICARYGVPVVEDAAEALGATCGSKKAGTFGALAVFSFNGNKIITTSGGGMLVSESHTLIARARHLSTQARDDAPHYQHSTVGYNYRMSNLLAAVGRGQLRGIEAKVERRRWNFERYRTLLADLPGMTFMPEAEWGRSTRWLTCLTVDPREAGVTREDIRLALESENIEARPLWKPMHLQPLFDGARFVGNGVAEWLFEQGLCLPSGSSLSSSDLERVAGMVRSTVSSSYRAHAG
ncbi:MAG: DegT/DnrJ/EryC1/StrS family aminotransferase [Thermoanaerobaculia bacterium]